LMDCAFDITVHFCERLQQRLDVDKAMDLLLLRPSHVCFTADVFNCLAMVEKLREILRERDTPPAERDMLLLAQKDALIRQQSSELALKDAALKAMFDSTSWQMTAPLRKAVTLARRRRQPTITSR